MAYKSLGARKAVAAADATGNNTGNLTTVFDVSALGITVPVFELYRAVVKGVSPAGTTADIFIDNYETSYNIFGSGAEWDPTQPPLLQPGQTLYFYWDLAIGAPAPVTTCWFRYDPFVYGAPSG